VPFPLSDQPDAGAELDAGRDAARDAGADADAIADATPDVDLMLCPQGAPPKAYLIDGDGLISAFAPRTLTMTPIGTPRCGATGGVWTLSVSREGIAYVVFEDWNIYAVDLASLRCTRTPFVFGQLGIGSDYGIAVSRDPSAEHLYLLGSRQAPPSPRLGVSDLTSFVLSPVPYAGTIVGAAFDIQADIYGHLFIYTQAGDLSRMDLGTMKVEWSVPTHFNGPSDSWAVMPYEDQLYLFANDRVARFDQTTATTTVLTSLPTTFIVGASAVACKASP
jgi:hypothetical protein